MDERTATVNIGGQEYEMLLTTRATKAIAGRYGGLENLGEKLMKAENFEMALDEIVWLITLLCNQPIRADAQRLDRCQLGILCHHIINRSSVRGNPGRCHSFILFC